jgi:hypothetical protein
VRRIPGGAGDRALVVDDTNRDPAPAEASDYGEAVEVASQDHRAGRRLEHPSIAQTFIPTVILDPWLPAPIALIYDAI